MDDWCNDTLHTLLGYSDGTLASYLIHVAKKAKSVDEISNVLKSGGIEPTSKSEQFSHDLYQRCRPSSSKPKRVTNADMIKRASKYKLVEEEKYVVSTSVAAVVPAKKREKKSAKVVSASKAVDKQQDEALWTSKKSKKRKHSSRRRAYSESSSEEEDTHALIEQYHMKERRGYSRHAEEEDGPTEAALTEEERAELERQKDLTERDEFIKRINKRDKNRSKDRDDDEDGDGVEAARADQERQLSNGGAVVDESSGKVVTMSTLREESRRSYLKKREEKELKLLERQLQDEEELFGGESALTEAERRRIEMGREILRMAKQRGIKEEDKRDGYHLPDEVDEKLSKADRDASALTSRYVEEVKEKTEQELWEESQTNKAMLPKKSIKKRPGEKVYDYVFEDQIDFVSQEVTKAYNNRDRKRSGKESKSSKCEIEKVLTPFEKIQVGRKKLPVYPYREDFLAAVKDHQVMVLVGETGLVSVKTCV